MPIIRILSILLCLALLGACSYMPELDKVLPDKRTEYRKSEKLPDLEIPPDLTADSVNESMSIPGEQQDATTLREFEQQRARRGSAATTPGVASADYPDEQWLAVQGSTTEVWPKLREFWRLKGYTLDLDDADLGVQETHWQERETGNRTLRDKFKVFSEAGADPGVTVLFITNEREEKGPGGDEWLALERSIEQEKSLVGELNLHFYGKPLAASAGAERAASEPRAAPAAQTRKKAEILSAGEGKTYLAIPEEFTYAWRQTEQALQEAGIQVEGSDQEKGLYYILYLDEKKEEKKGMLSKLKFWGDDEPEGTEYQVSLTGVGNKTELIILSKQGDWVGGETANRILALIQNLYNR